MDGSAAYWFTFWKEKARNKSWEGLKAAMLNRFGGGCRGTVFERLATLRQEGSVEEFVRNFEVLTGHMRGILEEQVFGYFIAGLREDVKGQVRIQKPADLMEAMRVARDVEDAMVRAQGSFVSGFQMNPFGSRSSGMVTRSEPQRTMVHQSGRVESVGSTLRDGAMPNANTRGSNAAGSDNRERMVRNVPYPEFLKREEEGRCFRCGGSFAPGHRCLERSLRVLFLVKDEEEVGSKEMGEADVKSMEMIAWSTEGMTPPKTMKLMGWIGGRSVVVLIDSGANHNFINRELVEELKLSVMEASPYQVSLGDGQKKMTRERCDHVLLSLGEVTMEEDFYLFDLEGVDIILGIAWLAKLGDMVINWRAMTMSYNLAGKMVKVGGDPVLSRKLMEPKALLKLAETEMRTLVWELSKVENEVDCAWHGVLTDAQEAELSAVLSRVFREITRLPPLRDKEHHIPLKNGINPINVLEIWKLGLVERKKRVARRDLESGGGRTKNNKAEENYTAHESSNLYEADSRWTSWLVPMFVVANIVVFVISMYINNCFENNPGSQGSCMAKFRGRFSFEPKQGNLLLGSSSSTLTALRCDNVVSGQQGWRLVICNGLHAGIIHFIVGMLSLLVMGIRLEQQVGV
ncbi:uncharacterized protein LOC111240668 [Vigna radiata var. radiata]|uniref:RHOMBOID-like protein n=1 Tax=Vigna radiata var. radiata TaxID=3916 RepID=A0A3Q0ENA8_VIGRR|nr:uncharacterized protein LOC111240668 [Vigna radiata var. radiata]